MCIKSVCIFCFKSTCNLFQMVYVKVDCCHQNYLIYELADKVALCK